MRTLLKIIFAFAVFWLWLSLARNYYICHLKGFCTETGLNQDSICLAKLPKTLNVEADGIKILENQPEFFFEKGIDSCNLLKAHKSLLSQLAAMLKSQPASRLLICAKYRADETEKLAHDRISKIANYLKTIEGISEMQLLSETLLSEDSSGTGLLGFELLGYIPPSDLLLNREDSLFRLQWKDDLGKVSYNGLLGIFEPAAEEMKTSPAFLEYCDSLKAYLKTKPKAELLIIGHTDTHAAENEADGAAKHFAELMKNQLKKAGIKHKMTTNSMGSKAMLQDDRLPDQTVNVLALAKNRRVEITVLESKTAKKSK